MTAPLPPERIRELLGGYATGTLTPAERAALMQAALQDQALFDELMEEEDLREALADRAFRAELLQALQSRPRWWRSPWPWTALASATAAAALFVLLRPQPQGQPAASPLAVEIAANLPKPESVPSAVPVPRTLQIHEEARRTAQAAAESPVMKTAERKDAGAAGLVPAAPPAEVLVAEVPAPQRAVRVAPEAQFAFADALKEDRQQGGEVPEIEIASQQPDGSWKTAGPGTPLPAGRPLRLRITSPAAGTLLLEPRLAAPLAVEAGAPAEWLLPAQSHGELVLRISWAAPARSAAPIQMERVKARAGGVAADSVVQSTSANRPALFPREIRLRIE